jgi:hypothetical protein
MVALSRLVPSLGVSQLGATMSHQQANWVALEGDSTFRTSEGAPDTLTGQLLQLPLGLVNAMFRPQLFDVNNVNALVSAIEMTFITLVIARILMQNGITRVFARVQRSPMLLMSAIIAVIGCAFVGLVTFNFGSLVRYRVPFLPFYGVLLSALSEPDAARVKKVVVTKRNPRELMLAKALRRRDEQRKAG